MTHERRTRDRIMMKRGINIVTEYFCFVSAIDFNSISYKRREKRVDFAR